jgi:methionyl-tRNA formyltransferase
MLKIYRSQKQLSDVTQTPGTIESDKKTFLQFAAPDGWIRVLELQLEGKKKMNVGDFLRGYKFASLEG